MLVGGPLWQPAAGQVGGAILLDGVDDCLTTPFILNPSSRAVQRRRLGQRRRPRRDDPRADRRRKLAPDGRGGQPGDLAQADRPQQPGPGFRCNRDGRPVASRRPDLGRCVASALRGRRRGCTRHAGQPSSAQPQVFVSAVAPTRSRGLLVRLDRRRPHLHPGHRALTDSTFSFAQARDPGIRGRAVRFRNGFSEFGVPVRPPGMKDP